MAAVITFACGIATSYAQTTDCPHVHHVSLLLGATAVDLAHLELDAP